MLHLFSAREIGAWVRLDDRGARPKSANDCETTNGSLIAPAVHEWKWPKANNRRRYLSSSHFVLCRAHPPHSAAVRREIMPSTNQVNNGYSLLHTPLILLGSLTETQGATCRSYGLPLSGCAARPSQVTSQAAQSTTSDVRPIANETIIRLPATVSVTVSVGFLRLSAPSDWPVEFRLCASALMNNSADISDNTV